MNQTKRISPDRGKDKHKITGAKSPKRKPCINHKILNEKIQKTKRALSMNTLIQKPTRKKDTLGIMGALDIFSL